MKDYLKTKLVQIMHFIISFRMTYNDVNLSSILIIAPHPDDEIIGLGGFMLKTIQQGGKFHLIYLTNGEGSGVWSDTKEIGRQRIKMSETVCDKLRIESITRMHLPDGAVPQKVFLNQLNNSQC